MAAKRTAFLDPRMIDVAIRVSDHADPFHGSGRAPVVLNRKGKDLIRGQTIEGEGHSGVRLLACITMAPIKPGKAPTGFDARSKMRSERYDHQANEADNGCHTGNLDRPIAQSKGLVMAFHDLDDLGGRVPIKKPWEVAHDLRVGIQCRLRLNILFAPMAEGETLGSKDGRHDALLHQHHALVSS